MLRSIALFAVICLAAAAHDDPGPEDHKNIVKHLEEATSEVVKDVEALGAKPKSDTIAEIVMLASLAKEEFMQLHPDSDDADTDADADADAGAGTDLIQDILHPAKRAPECRVTIEVDSAQELSGACDCTTHGALRFLSDALHGVTFKHAGGAMEVFHNNTAGAADAPSPWLAWACSAALGETHTGQHNMLARAAHINLYHVAMEHFKAHPAQLLQDEAKAQTLARVATQHNRHSKDSGKICPGRPDDANSWIMDPDGQRIDRIGMCGIYVGWSWVNYGEWSWVCGGTGCRKGCAYHDKCECEGGYTSSRCMSAMDTSRNYKDFCDCCDRNCNIHYPCRARGNSRSHANYASVVPCTVNGSPPPTRRRRFRL